MLFQSAFSIILLSGFHILRCILQIFLKYQNLFEGYSQIIKVLLFRLWSILRLIHSCLRPILLLTWNNSVQFYWCSFVASIFWDSIKRFIDTRQPRWIFNYLRKNCSQQLLDGRINNALLSTSCITITRALCSQKLFYSWWGKQFYELVKICESYLIVKQVVFVITK